MDEDIREIHQTARHLNALDGITGLLLFNGVRFLQMIEGSEDAIDGLVELLRRDPRHSAFEVRDERFVDRRSFPDWSMELVRLDDGEGDAEMRMAAGLPEEVAPAIRDLIAHMVCGLSAAPEASGRRRARIKAASAMTAQERPGDPGSGRIGHSQD